MALNLPELVHEHAPIIVRSVVGVVGIGLVVAGVANLFGWEWGAITAGLPIAGFYLYGELRAVRGAAPREGE